MRGAIAALLIAVAAPAAAAFAFFGQADIQSGIDRARARAERGDVEGAIADLVRLEREAGNSEIRGHLLLDQALLLDMQGKEAEALAALDRSYAALPQLPALPLTMFSFGRENGRTSIAAHALERLIAVFPEQVRSIPPRDVGPLLGQLQSKGRGDKAKALRLRLAEIGFAGDLVDVRDAYRLGGIRAALDAGEVDRARALAGRIDEVEVLALLLTDRRYAALWPVIEARARPSMRTPIAAGVALAERTLAAQPGDVRARRSLFEILRSAGRLAEADKVAAGFAPTPADLKTIGEDAGWLIDGHASVLAELGRVGEADARYALLAGLDIEQRPWLISMSINRAALAVTRGEPAHAARLLVDVEPLARTYGSPYAQLLVRHLTLCDAARRGDLDGIERLMPAIVAETRVSPGAVVESLLCAGREDEAAARLIAMLGDDNQRQGAIARLTWGGVTRTLAQLYPAAAPRLLARADVRAALDRVGRPLPDDLRPE